MEYFKEVAKARVPKITKIKKIPKKMEKNIKLDMQFI